MRPVVILCACVTGVWLVTADVASAPIPKGQPERPVYFPVVKGTQSVFEMDGKTVQTHTVTAAEKKDGGCVVSVSYSGRDGKVFSSEKVLASERGLIAVESLPGARFDTDQWRLKLSSKPDDTWETKVTYQEGTLTTTHTARGPERVVVPAGAFDAVRVDRTYTRNAARAGRSSQWYAPGVGLVKATNDGGEVMELKSFVPGKP